ncbi:hypothetical protein C8Q73DRAFT_694638 [Cubamyces lactineus]|nr:hypothetical protein C8Q73DRAFT_694638 [Cubamyces lactineus]
MARRPARIGRLDVLLLAAIIQWSTFWRGVRASTPCANATFSWMNNADGLSPCDVYGTLLGACDGQTCRSTHSTMAEYPRVRDRPQTPCFCNTLSYSLRAACELCTNVAMQMESEYTASQCDQSFLKTFPCSVPPNVVVPEWAYQDVLDGWFNVTLASQIAVGQATSTPPTSSSHDRGSASEASATESSASQVSSSLSSAIATTTQSSAQSITLGPPSQSIVTPTYSPGGTTRPQTGDVPSSRRYSSINDGSANPGTSMSSLPTASAVANTTAPESAQSNAPTNKTKSPGSLIGAVVGGLAMFNIVAVLVVLYFRRRRRRQREAAHESGPLHWWKRPPECMPQPVHRAASECTTIIPEDGDLLSDDEFAKKSVMYGNYPDI